MLAHRERRMSAWTRPKDLPAEGIGTALNPLVFWNMFAIWRRDDGKIMRCKTGSFGSGTPGRITGPFSDGLWIKDYKSTFSTGFTLYEYPLYVDANGNRVYAVNRIETAYNGRVNWSIIVRDQLENQISTTEVGFYRKNTSEFGGYSVNFGYSILGAIYQNQRNITGVSGDNAIFASADLTMTPYLVVPNIGQMRFLGSFGSYSSVTRSASVYSVIVDGIEHIPFSGQYIVDLTRLSGSGGETSLDRRIRLLGRPLTSFEIATSEVMFFS